MRNWVCCIGGILLIACSVFSASKCHDLHLVNGTIIQGIQYETEEMFGNRYIVYHYSGDVKMHRIKHSQVKEITSGECSEAPPAQTAPSMVPKTAGLPNPIRISGKRSLRSWRTTIPYDGTSGGKRL